MSRYKRASTNGEFFEVINDYIKVIFYKRLSGWGYAEIYTKEEKLMAVLDNLGELMVRDQEIPMRFEADSYSIDEKEDCTIINFNVLSTPTQKILDNTSFSPWMHYPFTSPCIKGTTEIVIKKDAPYIYYSFNGTANENMYVKYIRMPWLKVGEGEFGVNKTDGILPGVEWVNGTEWSSGDDWFRDPWFNKYAPIRNKVSIPCMVISHQGDAIGLSWNPDKWATRWFNYREHYPQPVFAAPDFINRTNSSLMGLMLPSATSEIDENQVSSQYPLEMHLHQMIRMECEIFVIKGNSLDGIVEWVKKHGMPETENAKSYYKEYILKLANHYNSNLWDENKGFGIPQRNMYSTYAPAFIHRFIKENKRSALAKQLQEKIKKADAIRAGKEAARKAKGEVTPPVEKISKYEQLLSYQREDGSFPFDPDGRHKSKDDFTVARVFCDPMGQSMDTALDMNVMSALTLMESDEEKYLAAAKKTLDFCINDTRPEGGDFWETPLHAPNLLATGHAAVAYYQAYRKFKDEIYLQKAIYWIRALLPFTHLWEPKGVKMLYNTKPCLCSSDWYFANWVRDHVQWEVLAVFNMSDAYNIDWAEVDKEIDWFTYRKGITCAGIRWTVDHTLDRWMPHNIPETYVDYSKGAFDGCFPDTHNCVTGNYGGMFIMPDTIANNAYSIMDKIDKMSD